MKIYTVERTYAYEGRVLETVCLSEEDARDYVEKEHKKGYSGTYEVKEWDVEQKPQPTEDAKPIVMTPEVFQQAIDDFIKQPVPSFRDLLEPRGHQCEFAIRLAGELGMRCKHCGMKE